MRLTTQDLKKAAEISAKAKVVKAAPKRLDEVSDAELEAMSMASVSKLEGCEVSKSTLFARINCEGMSVREAAEMPPKKPKKHKPSRVAKGRFHWEL
ncbi:hypothetical protein ACT3R7_11905 [Halomonas sp. AOP43-A1-21]